MSTTSIFVKPFHEAANISRAALYGSTDDPQMPRNLQDDARVPFLGFCGPRYQQGGFVFLAINPGGGGDAYTARTPQDRELIPLIEKFVASDIEHADATFTRMRDRYAAHVQSWNLWRIMKPTLAACNQAIDQICYLNVFPYRTAGDVLPSKVALRRAWSLVTGRLLAEFKPSNLVALGKKAGNIAAELHTQPPRLFVVPRTIGDSRVSTEAIEVLAAIRQSAT